MSLYRRHVIAGKVDGPRLLILAGVHGDEPEPMLAATELRRHIHVEDLRGRVTLIPLANESAYSRFMRTGQDGLDLARSFPGNPHGSLTERVAADLNSEIRGNDFLIDLHTGGTRLNIMPLTGFMLHADEKVLGAQREMAEAFDLPVIWGTSALLAGRSLSAARDVGVPAIYAERGGGGHFQRETVSEYIAGCLKVMAHLQMKPQIEIVSRVKFRVDDSGEESGNLQICHPAPFDGVFAANVRLGDRVVAGQELGRVINPHTEESAIVEAETSGMIIMLHTYPKVERGSGLCVILDVSRERDTSHG